MFRDQDDHVIALCDIRPGKNRLREYRLERTTNLFGRPAILIVWGRRGARKRTKLEDFEDEVALERRWRELLQRRVRHGYVLDESAARAERVMQAGPRCSPACPGGETRPRERFLVR